MVLVRVVNNVQVVDNPEQVKVKLHRVLVVNNNPVADSQEQDRVNSVPVARNIRMEVNLV